MECTLDRQRNVTAQMGEMEGDLRSLHEHCDFTKSEGKDKGKHFEWFQRANEGHGPKLKGNV